MKVIKAEVKPSLWGPFWISDDLVVVLWILAVSGFAFTPMDEGTLRLAGQAVVFTCFALIVIGSRRLHDAMVAVEVEAMFVACEVYFQHSLLVLVLFPFVLYSILHCRIAKTLQQSQELSANARNECQELRDIHDR